MRLLVIISFLDEERYLAPMLASMGAQSARPEWLVLVDDGSRDGSLAVARAFAAERPWVEVLERPARPEQRDRLVDAPELRSFAWALERTDEPWDVVAKLDADLELHSRLFESVRERFATEPGLGVTGSVLSVRHTDGRLVREPHPREHVRGPNKFYRRACFEQISPLPEILGWDTIDDLRARLQGWRTESFALADGETVHLRPTGMHDGRLRALRRWGRCAWGYGAGPVNVALGAVARGTSRRPYVISGLSYAWGYFVAALRRYPRAEPELRALVRRETWRRIGRALRPPADDQEDETDLRRGVREVAKGLLSDRQRSALLRAARPVWYRGDNVTCPCCDRSFDRLLAHRGVPNVRCPACGAMERHRLLWLFLQRHTDLFTRRHRVLHMAPEYQLQRRLKRLPNIDYVGADLASPLATVHCDIQALPFEDQSFDVVISNHVLEHIPDDAQAMAELHRVLTPHGWAVLMCPIARGQETTLEDPCVRSAEDALRRYGQGDHVRLYGSDYRERLEAAGFEVGVHDFLAECDTEVIERYALRRKHDLFEPDDVYIGRRSG